MIEIKKGSEELIGKALLVGVKEAGANANVVTEHLSELSELAKTLGILERPELVVTIREINPKYFIGAGKASEIANFAKEISAECVIFDCELNPSQQKNLEDICELAVMDRQELIIDIFAKRAKTSEAMIQVELARLEYLLPRLKRAWTHLSRQRGGALGTRGEGEKQIEVDRRMTRDKISSLKKSLEEIKKRRDLRKSHAEKSEIPRVAIIGYTNAGKSSLLKAMTGAEVYVEDKLFATLDTVSRKLEISGGQTIILADTVGFIRKLPHSLVAAFKSTLEEAVFADILIHVVDINSCFWEEHYRTTLKVLGELGASEVEIVTVFNKSDIVEDNFRRILVKNIIPDGIFISAKTGSGLDDLKSELAVKLSKFQSVLRLKIPAARHDLVASAHELGKVLELKYGRQGETIMTAQIPSRYHARFNSHIISRTKKK